jgi:UDP-3-O-[3-hydroxymyristoyl] glucosamine N-acyltransferase
MALRRTVGVGVGNGVDSGAVVAVASVADVMVGVMIKLTVGCAVAVGNGVSVGSQVSVGRGVFVGDGVAVGTATLVREAWSSGKGDTCIAAVQPAKDETNPNTVSTCRTLRTAPPV